MFTHEIVGCSIVENMLQVDHRLGSDHMVEQSEKNFLGMGNYEPSEDELYMSKEQQDHFERVLKYWLLALSKEVDSVVSSLQEELVVFDEIDRAAFEESQRMELRSSDRRRRLQSKITSALLRVKSGVYGYCKSCGAEIGLSRLEARPTADECIKCKTIAETYEQRGG